MDRLLDICVKHRIVLVEDAAHARGSECDEEKIGSFGHIACFGFQGVLPAGKPLDPRYPGN